jgi:hypothetical protein
MKKYTLFLLLLIRLNSDAQHTTESSKYFDTTQYYLVDSFLLESSGKSSIYIAFNNKNDESVIIHESNRTFNVYESFLTCYTCFGRGANGTTYGGHTRSGNKITFVQKYFNCIDSILVDFSIATPNILKIVRRSYNNEKLQGPDGAGNILFLPKTDVPITLFSMPIDRMDPSVKKHFNIKNLAWHPMLTNKH